VVGVEVIVEGPEILLRAIPTEILGNHAKQFIFGFVNRDIVGGEVIMDKWFIFHKLNCIGSGNFEEPRIDTVNRLTMVHVQAYFRPVVQLIRL
jgi:hypothetical protein